MVVKRSGLGHLSISSEATDFPNENMMPKCKARERQPVRTTPVAATLDITLALCHKGAAGRPGIEK